MGRVVRSLSTPQLPLATQHGIPNSTVLCLIPPACSESVVSSRVLSSVPGPTGRGVTWALDAKWRCRNSPWRATREDLGPMRLFLRRGSANGEQLAQCMGGRSTVASQRGGQCPGSRIGFSGELRTASIWVYGNLPTPVRDVDVRGHRGSVAVCLFCCFCCCCCCCRRC